MIDPHAALANLLWRYFERHMPEELKRRMDEKVRSLASEVAQKTTMIYLDREHILHCGLCPQRFGLHAVEIAGQEHRLCDRHYAQWQTRQKETTAQAQHN